MSRSLHKLTNAELKGKPLEMLNIDFGVSRVRPGVPLLPTDGLLLRLLDEDDISL